MVGGHGGILSGVKQGLRVRCRKESGVEQCLMEV